MEILSKIFEYTIEPLGRLLGRRLCYVIHCRTNIQKLQDRVDELKATRETIEIKVKYADKKGEEIRPDVQFWLKKVGEITSETDALLDEESQAKLKCLHGFCPNLTSRHQLGRESTKLVQEVVEQIEKGGFPQVSCGILRKEVWTVTNRDYQAFQSRIPIVKEIMDGLKDCDIQRIGVCGVGGVGKTILVKEVYKQASEDKTLFDHVVILLDVKKEPNPEAIQKKIVEQLSMDLLPDETIVGRASRLCAKIQGKKVLVILDDIQEKIDLEVMGFARQSTCKILMTSRTQEVFTFDEMRAEKVVPLDLLVEEETWSLFKRMAGDVVEQNDGVQDVAIKIAKKCGGLPLLVVIVASSLKGKKKLQAWKDALRRLSSFDEEEPTKNAYLWIYDQLDGKSLNPVFLLCGLIAGQNRIRVLDLFKYGMGLGLFKDLHTMDTLVDKLKDSCLLLDSDSAGFVRMDDLVCDVAKWITHRDHFVLSVEYGGELKKWPDKDFMKKCTKIYLRHINIPPLSELPLECPELEMFCLSRKDESMVIPSNFFSKMQELKVLDLTNMYMPSLPSSLQCLKTLQTLCLDHCKLGDVTLLGQLSSLEILSLICSIIEELPREIGQLTRLRLLDLSGCFSLKVIPHGVISSLVRLEDLRMRNSFDGWEIEGNASLSELKHLSQLYALEIHISNADILPANLFSYKIKKYNVLIGDTWKYPMDEMTPNTLKLRLTNNDTMGLDEGLKWLLKRSEDLSLDESVINVIQHLDAEDLKNLQHLRLKNSRVYNMNNKAVFSKLVTFVVQKCDNLRALLSVSTARSLVHLTQLNISSCELMQEIISSPRDDSEEKDGILPRLQVLKLKKLPKLVRFTTGNHIEFSALEELDIQDCYELAEFIWDNKVAVNNEDGRVGKEFGARVKEEEENVDVKSNTAVQYILFDKKAVFSKLMTFVVQKCDNLRALLSVSTARSLVHLTQLNISDCGLMQEIILSPRDGNEEKDGILPRLQVLELNRLPKLVRFTTGNHIEFSALEELKIQDCYELVEFIWDNKVAMTNEDGRMGKEFGARVKEEEENVDVKSNTAIQYILFDKKAVFSKLVTFVVQKCDNLRALLSVSTARSLVHLTQLKISSCELMQEIISSPRDDSEEKDGILPRLQVLELNRLPKLVRFTTGNHIEFSALEELKIQDCYELAEFIWDNKVAVNNEDGRVGKEFGTRVKEEEENVDVKSNTAVQYILFDKKAVFSKLVTFVVQKCDNLRALLSVSTARSLVHLTQLNISDCGLMQEIILSPRDGSEEKDGILPRLQVLKLKKLPKLVRFTTENHIEFSALEELDIQDCYELAEFIWDNKVAVNNEDGRVGKEFGARVKEEEENVDVKSNTAVQYILFEKKAVFSKLVTFVVQKCDNLRALLSVSTARSLVHLTQLNISDCGLMQEIILSPRDGSEEKDGILPRLQVLKLKKLPKLVRFTTENHIEFSALEELDIQDCYELAEFIWDNKVAVNNEDGRMGKEFGARVKEEEENVDVKSNTAVQYILFDKKAVFSKLVTFVVQKCDNLRALLSVSTARSLVHLTQLNISDCGLMQEIILSPRDGNEEKDGILPRLQVLELNRLPKLVRFTTGNHIEFSALEELDIQDCYELAEFIWDNKVAVNNEDGRVGKEFGARVKEEEENLDVKSNTAVQYILFDKKVRFPSLERLSIQGTSLKALWHAQLAPDSFWRLKQVVVWNCDKLISLFWSSLLGKLNALETLEIKWCKSLEVIFELHGKSKVEEIHVDTSVPHDQWKPFDCQNLHSVQIYWCESLKQIFPASVATCLQNLTQLEVKVCSVLTEIIGEEEEREGTETISPYFVFPKVTEVVLWDVPQLSSLYPKTHVSCWPLLKSLDMSRMKGYDKRTFATESSVSENILVDGRGFFSINQDSFPELERLELRDMAIWNGPPPAIGSVFGKLKSISFYENCAPFSNQASFLFLQRLPNLEKIEVGL